MKANIHGDLVLGDGKLLRKTTGKEGGHEGKSVVNDLLKIIDITIPDK